MQQHATDCQFGSFSNWVILSPIERSIKAKIDKIGTPLKDWNVNIYRGILTGYNDAFIIDEAKRQELITLDPKSDELIRPILRGRDVKRYKYDWAGLYLIATHNGMPEKNISRVDVNCYPAIKYHLDRHCLQLEKRTDQGDTPYNLRSCAYMEDFYQPKIMWAETMRIRRGNTERYPRFTYTEEPFFTDKTCFIATGVDLKLALAVLNSRIGRYQLSQTVSMMDNGGYLMQKIYVEKIRMCNFDKAQQREILFLVDKALKEPDDNIKQDIESDIDTIIINAFHLNKMECEYLQKTILKPLNRR